MMALQLDFFVQFAADTPGMQVSVVNVAAGGPPPPAPYGAAPYGAAPTPAGPRPLSRNAFGCVSIIRVQPQTALVDGEGMGAPAGTRVAQKTEDVVLKYLVVVGGWR